MAQKKGVVAEATHKPRDKVIGLKCPGGEPNQPRPKIIKMRLGDITRKALARPQPDYHRYAKAALIRGRIRAEVVVELSSGRVIWARTLSGHPLLRAAVNEVVCQARFSHGFINGPSLNAAGIITYTVNNSK